MKTKMINGASLAIALLLLLAATPATAQKGSFEIGVGAGLTDLGNKLGDDMGLSLDLRAGYFVTDRFELEVQNTQASTILEGAFTANTLNAVYHFGDMEGHTSYVLIGAGTADAELDDLFSQSPEDDGTALRAAVGARSWLGEQNRASVRLEISALFEDSFGQDSTHISLTCNFGWRFGG